MPDTKVRVVGSGFSTFNYRGQPIVFLEGVEDSGQRAFSDAGQSYQFIHPLGARHPVEIATSRVLAGGTLNLTIRELWDGPIWNQLAGLGNAQNIVDIYEILANDPSYVTCQTIIQPPGGRRPRGKVYHNCMERNTRYLTQDGTKTLGETVGTTQMVLGSKGQWTPAEIQEFGEQELYSVILTRNGRKKEIRATAGHRWFRQGRRPQKSYSEEITTTDLQSGDVLVSTFRPNRTAKLGLSPQGIQAGIVFGDGNVEGKARDVAGVSMWDEKEAELVRWFPLNRTRTIKSNRGAIGTRVVDLPKMYKTLPQLNIGLGFLYGWLAGYVATDGHVSKTGSLVLSSAQREHLEHVRDVCTLLGVRTREIRKEQREGFGKMRDIYALSISVRDLPEEFFLRSRHLENARPYLASQREYEDWVIESVEPTGETEEVYCAVVPDGQAFTLEDNILTGNCVVVDIADNDTITVGALAVAKGIVVAYTHSTAL